MFSRIIGTILLFAFVVMSAPVYALSDKDLEAMPMDDLVKLELRLKKILEIRKLESSIKKTQSKGNKSTLKSGGKGFGSDSTTVAPAKTTKATLPPTPVMPTLPVVSKVKVKRSKPVSPPVSLPKIISIWGDLEEGLLANLEIKKGVLTVQKGDKILSGRFRVTSISVTGVTLKDRNNKIHPLAFKPFEKIATSSKVAPNPVIPASTFGSDSVYVPPLPGQGTKK